MKNIFLILLYLITFKGELICQSRGSGYIIFISENDEELDISSVVYLESISGSDRTNQSQILELDGKYFKWKYLYLPTGNVDLIDCCELKVSSRHKREVLELADKLGETEFDSLSESYEQLYRKLDLRYDLFLNKINKGLKITEERYLLHIFFTKIEICDCQIVRADGSAEFPLGYEGYLSKVNQIYKMNKEKKHCFETNLKSLISVYPIKIVVDEIKNW